MGGLGRPPDDGPTISGSSKMLYHENSSQMRLNRLLSGRRGSEAKLSDEDAAKQTCRGTLLGDQDASKEVQLPLPRDTSAVKPESTDYEDAAGDGEATSEYTQSVGSSSGHYDPKQDVILRLEYITAAEHKASVLLMWTSLGIGVAFLILEFCLKFRENSHELPGRSVYALNVAIGGICCFALTYVGGNFIVRVIKCNREGRVWKHRRKRSATLYGAECLIQWVNAIFYIVPNVYVLANPCEGVTRLVAWCAIVRWTCWNSTFFLFVMHASNVRPWRQGSLDAAAKAGVNRKTDVEPGKPPPATPDKILMDAPIWVHWKLVPIWVVFEAFIFWCAFQWAYSDLSAMITKPPGASCSEWTYDCSVTDLILGTSIAMDAFGFLYIVLYIFLINLALRGLRRAPYHDNKMVWLQEFAWTEADLPKKIRDRNKSAPHCKALEKEPMFCFQTMINCLYWSCLVYDYEEVADSPLSLETAMSFYGLEHSELFWEKAMDTKMLLAWSRHTVMIAFRGTASMQNAMADLRAWRAVHPPSRGSCWRRPMVHEGFLKSWHANGLAERVIDRVRNILKSSDIDIADARVIVTGHSLGGALATLAAYDIRAAAKALGIDLRLTCYTFGQPRVGNHAFAHDFSSVVPDSWSIINDQDIVARGAKFFVLYKRGGQRVIINAHGDMIVRPTAVETSMQLTPGGGSVSQHYLGSYQRSILAVLLSQFSRKAFRGGMSGVHRLAQTSEPVQKLLFEGAGLSVGDIQRLERWGPSYTNRIAAIHHPEAMPHLGSQAGKSSCSRDSGSKPRRSTSLLKSRSSGGSSNGSNRSSQGATRVTDADVEAALEKLEEGKTDEEE